MRVNWEVREGFWLGWEDWWGWNLEGCSLRTCALTGGPEISSWKVSTGQESPVHSDTDGDSLLWSVQWFPYLQISPCLLQNIVCPGHWNKQTNKQTKKQFPKAEITSGVHICLGCVCSKACLSGHPAWGLLLPSTLTSPPLPLWLLMAQEVQGYHISLPHPLASMVNVHSQPRWGAWKAPQFPVPFPGSGHPHWLKMNCSMLSFCWLAVFRRSDVLWRRLSCLDSLVLSSRSSFFIDSPWEEK